MASNVRCFFLLLALTFCLQTHARDSKFFSKVSNENKESISIAPIQSPTLAPSPSPEPDVVEHGYGLYGQETYQYPPTTTNPTKTEKFGEDKFVSSEELSKNNFKEFGMGYSNDNFNGIGNEKQGMSDTRFLENGKYYYDVNQDVKDETSLYNGNKNEYVTERQGMSDTRFLENGKYFHDINQEGVNEGRNAHFITNNYENENENEDFEEKYGHHFNTNNFENENHNENEKFNTNNFENENHNENEKFNAEKQGMSDTRFLENGKYFYDPKNDHGVGDVGFHNNNNVEFANTFSRNGNEYGNGNNEYETQGRGGYNYYHGNEYHVEEGREGYKPKKFPNEYDTMEEYDREQGYIDGHEDEYVP